MAAQKYGAPYSYEHIKTCRREGFLAGAAWAKREACKAVDYSQTFASFSDDEPIAISPMDHAKYCIRKRLK